MKNQYGIKRILASLLMSLLFTSIALATGQGNPTEPISPGLNEPELIPDVFIPYAPKPGGEYVFIVDKGKQTLYLYEYKDKPKKIYQLRCSTGKSIGAKTRSGDRKTPEGVYYFIKRHEDKELAPVYGIRAFPTDYPNLLDRHAERTGSAIWLHGTDRKLIPRDSNGCVALENENVQKITPFITLNRTPIIITDHLEYTPLASKKLAASAVSALIRSWGNAVENGRYHDYVRFYDAEYVPDITWWQDWLKFRKKHKDPKTAVNVKMEPLSIFKHNDTYVALVSQTLSSSKTATPVGIKKLFIKQQGTQFSIIGETYQKILLARAKNSKSHPVLLAARMTVKPPKAAPVKPVSPPAAVVAVTPPPKDIEQFVAKWAKNWSAGNIPAYGNLYANDFRGKGMNKSQWLKYKKTLSKKYKYIRVSYRGLKTRPAQNGLMKASFVQKYKSSAFTSRGIKELLLKKENGEWKIYRETMIKKL